jgi:hypothetical protein
MQRCNARAGYLFGTFGFICLVVALGQAVREFVQLKSSDIVNAYKTIVGMNLQLRWRLLFNWNIYNLDGNHYFTIRASDCLRDLSVDWYDPLKRLYLLGERYSNLLDVLGSNHALPLRLATATATALQVAGLGLALSGALYVSFGLTLWLLSRAISSTLKLTVMIALTIIIAVVMPPLLISLVMQLLWFMTVFTGGGIIDFSSFSDPNWFTVTLVMGFVFLAVTQPMAALFAEVTYLLPFWAKVVTLAMSSWSIAGMTYFRLLSFFSEIRNVLHFDFSGALGDAMVNWAIVTDLLFSLSYIIPAFALVALHQNLRVRTTVLDLLQYVSEHPRGVLIAIADMIKAPFRWSRP